MESDLITNKDKIYGQISWQLSSQVSWQVWMQVWEGVQDGVYLQVREQYKTILEADLWEVYDGE